MRNQKNTRLFITYWPSVISEWRFTCQNSPHFKMGAGGPIGDGKQYMPWIHINDMVRAICFLLDTPTLSGPFNMTSPYPVHNDLFSATLGDVLNRPSFVRTPAFVIKAIMGNLQHWSWVANRRSPND